MWSVGASVILAPVVVPIFYGGYPYHWFTEVSWRLAISPVPN